MFGICPPLSQTAEEALCNLQGKTVMTLTCHTSQRDTEDRTLLSIAEWCLFVMRKF